MPLIDWDDCYCVQAKELDDDHKALVGLLNDLFDAMRAAKSHETIGQMLDKLIEHTVAHFANEERLMDKYAYSAARQHKEEHVELTERVLAIKKNYDTGASMITMKVVDYLKKWLVDHILDTDRKLGEFLRQARKSNREDS